MTLLDAVRELRSRTKTYCCLTVDVTVGYGGTEEVAVRWYVNGFMCSQAFPTLDEAMADARAAIAVSKVSDSQCNLTEAPEIGAPNTAEQEGE